MRRVFIVMTGVVMLGLAYAFFWAPPGPRTLRAFDPDRTAALELRMWQSYYERRNVRLFADLVTLGHEQYRYPWAKATIAAFHLARAAATFAKLRSDYEQVLPDLERAYTILERLDPRRLRSPGGRTRGAGMVDRATCSRTELGGAGRAAPRGRERAALRSAARARAGGVDPAGPRRPAA